MPFGEIEEKLTVNFNQRHTYLYVSGLTEVLQEPETIKIKENSL